MNIDESFKSNQIIKSLCFDQHEILRNIMLLHNNNQVFECDLTYGNGSFYKNIEKPKYCLDIEPLDENVIQSCSTKTPIESDSIKSVVFDPPFLTYIRAAREGNGKMVMAGRFSGYWKYDELEKHYKDTLKEMQRILCKKGIVVFKCQDIIHNHKIHCTHANVINWASDCNFRLKDLFILGANHRMPSPNRKGKQKHARVFHSYFLVLVKN